MYPAGMYPAHSVCRWPSAHEMHRIHWFAGCGTFWRRWPLPAWWQASSIWRLCRNPHGLWDSILAYSNYWHRGNEVAEHRQPWFYYLEILFAFRPHPRFLWSEGLIGGLAVLGAVVGFWPRGRSGDQAALSPHPALVRFLAFYTLFLTILYSLIPYKTPWCEVEFLGPMTLLAGVGAEAVFRRLRGDCPEFRPVPLDRPKLGLSALLRALAALALAAGMLQLGWQSYHLNFRFAADPRNPYCYAHTPPDLVRLAGRLDLAAQRLPAGHDMLIHVVADNFWPLPWYLRHFNPERVGYWRSAAEWAEQNRSAPRRR